MPAPNTGKRRWPKRDEAHLELQRLLARLAPGVVAVPPVVDLRRMALEEVRRAAGRARPFLLAAWLRWRGKVGDEHLAERALTRRLAMGYHWQLALAS